jgi:hypothetical protein
MDRQYTDKLKKDKKTNNGLQAATQQNRDWATRTLQTTEVNSSSPGGYAVPAPLVIPVVLLLSAQQPCDKTDYFPAPLPTNKCFTCGDIDMDIPCYGREVFENRTSSATTCTAGHSFCMTDIIQDAHGNTDFFKR